MVVPYKLVFNFNFNDSCPQKKNKLGKTCVSMTLDVRMYDHGLSGKL